jgi:adenylosuccinate lyase
VARIAGDDAFGLDEEGLLALMDARRFVGRAPEQVDRFLAEAVEPVLERLGAGAAARLDEARVHV